MNGTVLVGPFDAVVRLRFLTPTAADAEMFSVAVTVVGLTTINVPDWTVIPATGVRPLAPDRFVPVNVTGTLAPSSPEDGLRSALPPTSAPVP